MTLTVFNYRCHFEQPDPGETKPRLDVMVRVVADGLRAALGQAIFADMVMAVADSAELQFELVILRCPATFDLDVRHAISLTTLLEAVLQSFQAADLASSHGFFT